MPFGSGYSSSYSSGGSCTSMPFVSGYSTDCS